MSSFLEDFFGSPSKQTFSAEEAATLVEQAKQMKQTVRSTKKGYKALTSIINSETDIHCAWRKLQIEHAKGETKKSKADAKTFGRMGKLADTKAKAVAEAEDANHQALVAVNQYANKYKQEARLFGFKLW